MDMEVVGYVADLTVLCPECLSARGYSIGGTDSTGHPVRVVFRMELDGGERCHDCRHFLLEAVEAKRQRSDK